MNYDPTMLELARSTPADDLTIEALNLRVFLLFTRIVLKLLTSLVLFSLYLVIFWLFLVPLEALAF